MDTKFPSSQPYLGLESTGVIVLVTCGMLSSISVLGMIVVLWRSSIQSHRSSNKMLFVRTRVARYFFSLLICNLFQGVGALFNIAWIVEMRVEIGTRCTAQATITQFGNVGTAIFSFVIAAHAFSQLFLRRQWPDLAYYLIFTASWGLLLLNLSIGYFVVADPKRGPYYGIAGHWCGITPAYPIARYASEYLLMSISAVFSFILYSLVFLRLRGNITIADGHKVHFHQRPDVKDGRTSAGTYVTTDDRHDEMHMTTAAKQMLLHPIAYTVLVLPICFTSFYTPSGTSFHFPATVSTAAVFVLIGFVNVVLFYTTRRALPGSLRQKFGIGATLYSLPGDISLPSRTNETRRLVKTGGRISTTPDSIYLNISVEKDIEIKYDETEPNASSPNFSRVTLPTEPLPTHDGILRDGTWRYHIQQLSFPPPLRIRLDGDGLDKNARTGVHPGRRLGLHERFHSNQHTHPGGMRVAWIDRFQV